MTAVLKRLALPAILLFSAGLFIGVRFGGVSSGPSSLEDLRKLEDAFVLIDRQYVEEVPSGKLVERAIEAMLEELDPHSSYISEERVKQVQEGYRGNFGGIGIWFEAPPADTARVTAIVSDGPSEQVGVMPGDLIIAVNDSSVIGMISTQIQDRLKGTVGTPVNMTVRRHRVEKPITFTITRGLIPLYSIDSSYMLDSETGYVRIGRFAMTTGDEFREHLSGLITSGMKRLVLDLRDNPGGIKQTAVQVADELLPGGKTIVYTKGRDPRESETDRSTSGGLFESGPVIVLVNENTASGSEIVSGALQDHDRALVVGRRTFGKGLVQRPFAMRDGSVLQLTVSRYYMPSGRLIQSPYDDGDAESYYKEKFGSLREATYDPAVYLQDIPDSLRFETAHGRTVFGGGGVMPDVVIAPDTTSSINAPLVAAIVRPSTDVTFVRTWFLEREEAMRAEWGERKADFIATFEVDDAMMDAFWTHAAEQGVTIGPDADGKAVFSAEDAAASDVTLRTVIKGRLAQRLFRSEAWFPVFNPIDPTFVQAIQRWTQAEDLTKIQGGGRF